MNSFPASSFSGPHLSHVVPLFPWHGFSGEGDFVFSLSLFKRFASHPCASSSCTRVQRLPICLRDGIKGRHERKGEREGFGRRRRKKAPSVSELAGVGLVGGGSCRAPEHHEHNTMSRGSGFPSDLAFDFAPPSYALVCSNMQCDNRGEEGGKGKRRNEALQD